MEINHGIDVACVIHGELYPWQYVDNLYGMVRQNLNKDLRFHVFTEPNRSVPDHMIRHDLRTWPGISGRKKGWWYKMQMFDPRHGLDQILYFDLDVVITRNIDWITGLDPRYFWTLRDFKYLWRPGWSGANTSVMWWNAKKFDSIWSEFIKHDIRDVVRKWPGDQDYITDAVNRKHLRFIDSDRVRSWRWQIFDGGMDMRTRTYRDPGAGPKVDAQTDIIIFHGRPKPADLPHCELIQQNWFGVHK